ncbi:MAG: hypothetical protein KDI42_00715, partial [Gammaproteobacteria bacterium]|nr:hypothetical protein [Gammaproteobacteria bacterium]
ITMPHASSGMVRGLLGIAELDRVADELQGEVDADRRHIDELQASIEAIDDQLGTLNVEESALAELQAALSSCGDDARDAQRRVAVASARRAQLEELGSDVETQVNGILSSDVETRFRHWQERADHLGEQVSTLEEACLVAESDPPGTAPGTDLIAWIGGLRDRVAAFAAIRARADVHAEEEKQWLGRKPLSSDTEADPEAEADVAPVSDHDDSYPAQRAHIEQELAGLPGKRRVFRLLAFFGLVIAVATITVRWLLAPEVALPEGEQLVAQLRVWFPNWDPQTVESLLAMRWTAGGALTIGLLSILRGSALSRRIRRLRFERERLDAHALEAREHIDLIAEIDEHPMSKQLESLRALHDPDIDDALDAFTEGDGKALIDAEALAAWREPLADDRDMFREDLDTLLDTLGKSVAEARHGADTSDRALADAETAVENEERRRAEAEALSERQRGLRGQLQEPRERIKLRKLGLDQIRGTCRRIYNDFNVQMRDYLVRIVPLFTEGRYRHLKIDDEFKVQVFSNDKNDFVELEELSSGTHRQLVLGVRLALSQAMVDAQSHGAQSMILDEPFAFFDRERIRQTLETLPTVSDEISQIWVISQEFDEASFDLHLACRRDSDTLIASA